MPGRYAPSGWGQILHRRLPGRLAGRYLDLTPVAHLVEPRLARQLGGVECKYVVLTMEQTHLSDPRTPMFRPKGGDLPLSL